MTWTTTESLVASHGFAWDTMVTDAAGTAYAIVDQQGPGVTAAAVVVVNTRTGSVIESVFSPAVYPFDAPWVLADGTVDFGWRGNELGRIDRASAVILPAPPAWTNPGFLPGANPAIGADGSLYFGGRLTDASLRIPLGVTRFAPDAHAMWATHLASDDWPTASSDFNAGSYAPVALAPDGQVVVAVTQTSDTTTSPEHTRVFALDPATGAVRWTQVVAAQLLAGPAVGADGSIALAVANGLSTGVTVLEPTRGATRFAVDVPGRGIPQLSLGRDGTIFLATQQAGVDGVLAAVAPDGTLEWQFPIPAAACPVDLLDLPVAQEDAFGVVVLIAADAIRALDPVDGTVRWTLAPPHADSCIVNAAFATGSTLVGVLADGTVFGVGD